MKNQATNLKRVEDGRRSALLVDVGIPPVYHGVSLSADVEKRLKKFMLHEVVDFDSALFVVSPQRDILYRTGSRLAEMAVDMRVSVNMMGLRPLLAVRKASFRDPEPKALLKNKFGHSDIIIFANVTKESLRAWCDERDLSWLRGIIKQRVSMKKKTVFCTSFHRKSMVGFLGDENKKLVDNAVTLHLGSDEWLG